MSAIGHWRDRRPRLRRFAVLGCLARHAGAWSNRVFGLAISAVVLAGCYLPTQFEADIVIAGNGEFSIAYKGGLTNVPLLTGLRDGSVEPGQETERVSEVRADLARDTGFKAIDYIGGGAFQVRYEVQGSFLQQRSMNFVRNDSRILSLKFLSDEQSVTVTGGTVPVSGREQLASLGYNMQGVLRVATELPVDDHNADEIIEASPRRIYVWNIAGMDGPAPKLVIR